MKYISSYLNESISITEIYSIRYYEYMSDFYFPGESHDFWELVCVDKGEVFIYADEEKILLKRNDLFFHRPNEFHSVKATGAIAPNLIVISFSCHNPYMDFFCKKLMNINNTEKMLLASIITEARNTFSSPLGDPYLFEMHKCINPPFASEQLLKIHIEELLIQLYRRHQVPPIPDSHGLDTVPKLSSKRTNEEILARVIKYMEDNISAQTSIDTICRNNFIGKSKLQNIFHEYHGHGIIEHFSKMKIEKAKEMIRSKQKNFSQISELLGYNSVHYFSRQFKHITGMTPSEYASSVKAISEIK